METPTKQETASQWVHQYSDMLLSYAVQRVNDSHTARDMVQETFLEAWKRVDSYNGKASVKTWLFTILKNKIIDHYRKTSTRVARELVSLNDNTKLFFDEVDHWAVNTYPQKWGINYRTPIESNEFYSILDSCRSKLKEIQNTVFSLKYLDGLESEEICKLLQISLSNYWVMVHRAKIQLRACLEKNWFTK